LWKKREDGFECLQCGNCCRWAGFDYIEIEDRERWINEGRKDILKYVGNKITKDNSGEDCYVFTAYSYIPDIRQGIDREPCVFLRKNDGGKYECSIHDTKPTACKKFPRIFFYHPYCNGIRKILGEGFIDAKQLIKELSGYLK